MNKLFIHCGAPKTGTSYLQVLFARHCDDLAAAGVIYPQDASTELAKSGQVTSGNGVDLANYLRPELPHNIADKDAFAGTLKDILAAHKGKDVLLSSEFIAFPRNERTDAIAQVIAEAGFEAQLIYFARDIASVLRSTYSQQIKRHGEQRSLMEFVTDWDPNYSNHVTLMIEAFGAENLHLYNYEEHKGALADFFFGEVLGTDIKVQGDFSTNRSLSDTEIELMRLMNGAFPPNHHHLSTFVSDALLTIPKGKIEVTTNLEEFELLKKRFGQSLAFLNQHIRGQKLRITPKLVEGSTKVQIGDFEAAVMAVLAKMITQQHGRGR